MAQRRAAVAVINRDNYILLGKKKQSEGDFLAGKWHVPGGTLEKGETYEQALPREMKEETGLIIQIGKYLGSHRTPKHTLVRWYECAPLPSRLRSGSDLEAVMWIRRESALDFLLRNGSGNAVALWGPRIRDYFKRT